jgi:hypothetical protein
MVTTIGWHWRTAIFCVIIWYPTALHTQKHKLLKLMNTLRNLARTVVRPEMYLADAWFQSRPTPASLIWVFLVFPPYLPGRGWTTALNCAKPFPSTLLQTDYWSANLPMCCLDTDVLKRTTCHYINKGYRDFPKILKPPQNSGRQNGDMKQVPPWGPDIRRPVENLVATATWRQGFVQLWHEHAAVEVLTRWAFGCLFELSVSWKATPCCLVNRICRLIRRSPPPPPKFPQTSPSVVTVDNATLRSPGLLNPLTHPHCQLQGTSCHSH